MLIIDPRWVNLLLKQALLFLHQWLLGTWQLPLRHSPLKSHLIRWYWSHPAILFSQLILGVSFTRAYFVVLLVLVANTARGILSLIRPSCFFWLFTWSFLLLGESGTDLLLSLVVDLAIDDGSLWWSRGWGRCLTKLTHKILSLHFCIVRDSLEGGQLRDLWNYRVFILLDYPISVLWEDGLQLLVLLSNWDGNVHLRPHVWLLVKAGRLSEVGRGGSYLSVSVKFTIVASMVTSHRPDTMWPTRLKSWNVLILPFFLRHWVKWLYLRVGVVGCDHLLWIAPLYWRDRVKVTGIGSSGLESSVTHHGVWTGVLIDGRDTLLIVSEASLIFVRLGLSPGRHDLLLHLWVQELVHPGL